MCYLGMKSDVPYSWLKIKTLNILIVGPRVLILDLHFTSYMILGKLLHLLCALTLNCEMGILRGSA